MTAEEKLKEHHIWCNYYMKPRKGCKMCERFYKLYPIDDLTHEELLKNLFPDATARIKT